MDSTPSKRRKLSPTTPSRASFMSPTKASLARFNPDLLARTRPATEGAFARKPIKSFGVGTSLSPRERVHTPRRASSPARGSEVSRNIGPTIAASPPAEAREAEHTTQEIVNEHLEHGNHSSTPQNSSNLDRARNLEPELPLTPTQLGLEPVPNPPKGLLSSSPSRRASRRKGAKLKSSPLKPRDPPPDDTGGDSLQKTFSSTDLGVEDSQLQPEATSVDEEILEKQEIRDGLLDQLQGIANDVRRLEAELHRVQDPTHPGAISQEECDELISVLVSENPTHRPRTPPPKPIPISTRLSQFLPFSKPTPPSPPKPSVPEKPAPSHHPIELEDPLPHLRHFTPLTIACEDTIIPSFATQEPLLQQREITLTSPFCLLMVKLSLITSPNSEAVESLSLTDVSPWADYELGSWIRKQLPSGDINSIGFATSRYWEVASIRSRCWQSCEDEFGDLLESKTSNRSTNHLSTKNLTDAKRRNRRHKPSHSPPLPNITPNTPPASDSSLADLEDELTSPISSRPSLHKHLSQTTLVLTDSSDGGDVSLLITWQIGFDWTGEVESYLSATTSFPAAWECIDERGSLGKVGEAFDMLVQERGVRKAVGAVVGLLCGRRLERV